MTAKIKVEFEVAEACEYKINKALNEFLRNSFREFAASYNITDYEVIGNECICLGCRNNNKQQRKPI